jgi:hypothetical protein
MRIIQDDVANGFPVIRKSLHLTSRGIRLHPINARPDLGHLIQIGLQKTKILIEVAYE